MQDFTLTTYKKLIQELPTSGYLFQTFQDFIQQPEDRTVILRHDVDRKPGNALVIAEIEKEAGGRRSEVKRAIARDRDPQITQITQIGRNGTEKKNAGPSEIRFASHLREFYRVKMNRMENWG